MLHIIITHKSSLEAERLSLQLIDLLTEWGIPYITSANHGISDRGNSSVIHVKIGQDSNQPLIDRGQADIIISGDPMASLNSIDFLKPTGHLVTETSGKLPKRAKSLGFKYPDTNNIITKLQVHSPNIHTIPASKLAKNVKNGVDVNSIILGYALSLGVLPLDWNVVQHQLEKADEKPKKDKDDPIRIGYRYHQFVSPE